MTGNIKNDNLNGSNFPTGYSSTSADFNSTFDEVALRTNGNSAACSQLVYRVLQAANILENGYFLLADEFLTNDGTKETVDTGANTTAFYSDTSQSYILPPGTDIADSLTAHDPDGFLSDANATDNDDVTYAYRSTYSTQNFTWTKVFGKTFSEKYISTVRAKVGCSGNAYNFLEAVKIQTYDGSTWTDFKTWSFSSGQNFDEIININSNVQGVRVSIQARTNTSTNHTHYIKVFSLEIHDGYNTDSKIVHCGNTGLTLDGSEERINLFCDAEIPSGTSMEVRAGDGTNWSNWITLQRNTTRPFDISSLSSGDLELDFRMNTTDSSKSPSFKGYGGEIFDNN